MAINVDLSKPLTDDQIEDLKSRLPESLVQRYIDLAGGEGAPAKDEAKAPAKPGTKGKSDDLL